MKERGLKTVVSCEGMRAEESHGRSKLERFKRYEGQSIAGRNWYKWLPIFSKSTDQVFKIIHNEGQKAFWTYYEGMSRKSCCFCIMAKKSDLQIAAKLKPELYQKYVDLEIQIGHTLQMSAKSLPDILK